jgi:hypothetical protein
MEGKSECGLLLKYYCESLISYYIFSEFLFLVQFFFAKLKKIVFLCSPIMCLSLQVRFRSIGSFPKELFFMRYEEICLSHWPRVLRRRSAATRPLRSWVWIPPGTWIFVCCECCVLLGRGLCDELITRLEESYRLWCVVVCDLEISRMRRPWPTLGRSATEKREREKERERGNIVPYKADISLSCKM